MRSKIYKIIHILILFLISAGIMAAVFMWVKFPKTNFEELAFYYKAGLKNADNSVFIDGVKFSAPYIVLIMILFYTLFYDITFGKIKKKFYPLKLFNNHRKIFTSLFAVIAIFLALSSFGIIDYLIYINSESSFIKDNYVDPRDVNIEFDEKRNLIVIVVESLETTFFTKNQGGYWKYEVTPELYDLLNEDDVVTFYNKNKAQGMKMIQGASWTTGSVVANSTGLPFKLRIEKNQYHSKDFMNGAYALGDLLKDNGYYNELISAARTSFGGLEEYFTKHGDYEIVDINSLDKYGLEMDSSDKGKWGFNDNYLFETAKKRLEVISKQEQPFNLELVTIDTHFTDGFIGDYSEDKFDTQYENVYATESRLIYDFVNWVREQDFYENTTILIVGDHLSMQDDYFSKRKAKDRYVYNCIINPVSKDAKNSGRTFTALDTYPTIVSAMGGKIEGNKLGLGVNLFSDEKTLAEKHKFKYLDKELQKKSDFYNDSILDDDYLRKYELNKGSE